MKNRLPVGVSILLTNEVRQVLLAKRDPSVPAGGLWSTPGGRVEADENIFQAAIRELKEETGLTVEQDDLTLVAVREKFSYGDHYIMFYFHTDTYVGDVQDTEPNKHGPWQWAFIEHVEHGTCTEPVDILEDAISCSRLGGAWLGNPSFDVVDNRQ